MVRVRPPWGRVRRPARSRSVRRRVLQFVEDPRPRPRPTGHQPLDRGRGVLGQQRQLLGHQIAHRRRLLGPPPPPAQQPPHQTVDLVEHLRHLGVRRRRQRVKDRRRRRPRACEDAIEHGDHGSDSTHCRTGTFGITRSTSCAASSVMRRPPHSGQKRPLQLSATTISSPHCLHRTCRQPRESRPQPRYASNSSVTNAGRLPPRSPASTCARNSKCRWTTR